MFAWSSQAESTCWEGHRRFGQRNRVMFSRKDAIVMAGFCGSLRPRVILPTRRLGRGILLQVSGRSAPVTALPLHISGGKDSGGFFPTTCMHEACLSPFFRGELFFPPFPGPNRD
jgi:hypothetical protein